VYLGDGKTHPDSLLISIGNGEERKPKKLVVEIVQKAYESGYGKLLDALNCRKWEALKSSHRGKTQYTLSLLAIGSG